MNHYMNALDRSKKKSQSDFRRSVERQKVLKTSPQIQEMNEIEFINDIEEDKKMLE